MLDFTAIKSLLLELPNITRGGVSSTPIPSRFTFILKRFLTKGNRYTKIVQTNMAKAESILKVILTPQATLVETYKALIADGNEADFQKIVDLKGLTRSEQKALLEVFTQQTGAQSAAGTKTIRSMLSDFENNLTGVFTITKGNVPKKTLFQKDEQ
jgi:hypothetical protein